jgi:predicted MFS family arabinose efflux permease
MYLIVLLNILLHGALSGSRVVVSLFAIKLGASPLTIGVIIGLYSVATLFLGLVAGRMCDRYGTRPPMLLGAVLLVTGLTLPYLWPQLATLLVSAVVAGGAFVFYNAAVQYFTGAYGPREQRAANFSTLSLGYSISGFIGPLTAGYAIDYFGHAQAYLCLAALGLIAVAILAVRRELGDAASPQPAAERKSALDLLSNRELRKVLVLGAMVVTGWDLYMFYLPIYAHSVGLSASRIGAILGVFAVATFIVRFGTPYFARTFSARRVLSVAMWFAACMFLAFPFMSTAWLLAAASFAIGLALGVGQPLSLLLAYNRSPPGRAGEVTGIRLMINHSMHASVPVLAGALGNVFGLTPVFLAIAGVLGYCGHLSSTVGRVGEASNSRA